MKILLIDEIALLKEMESSFLKRIKFQILLAENGSVAIQKAITEKPDLIILDTTMPQIDGLTCGQRIRDQLEAKKIPILLIASEQEMLPCRQAGFHDFIEKPVTQENIIKAISKFLTVKNRRSHRIPLSRKVKCLKKGQSSLELYSKNVSRDGIFLKSKDPLPKESIIEMNFALKSRGCGLIHAIGKVVRTVDDQKDSHLIAGMGVHFKRINERDQRDIGNYIERTLQHGSISQGSTL